VGRSTRCVRGTRLSPSRFLLRRSSFRQGGFPHQLVVLSDASRALHEEEHDAWKRLVRVLSHEINNSLAPISSVAGSLEQLLPCMHVLGKLEQIIDPQRKAHA